MKRATIIVAGGSGVRMGGDLPKQFLKVGNKPILLHTLETFHRFDPHMCIVIVLPASQLDYWKNYARKARREVAKKYRPLLALHEAYSKRGGRAFWRIFALFV